MTEVKLGTKHTCFSCGAKFYDLGKVEAICPKCGANQKDAGTAESQHATQALKRKRKPEAKAKAPLRDDVETLDAGLAEPDETLDADDLDDLDDELDEDLDLGDDEVEIEDDEGD